MDDDLQPLLLSWYAQNKRNLPWRLTNDPYTIWLSEVILQQTRVDQGLTFFLRFLQQWPNLASLATAQEHEVLKMWQGLGYYSRARNMLQAAKQIVALHHGVFPQTVETLRQLNGVGPYTAAAIASIAFGQRVAVVDGNVERFLSRFYGLNSPIDRGVGKRQIEAFAQDVVKTGHPATLNQAMMEFGALQCVPRNPRCNDCPLVGKCVAFQQDAVKQLPVKTKKKTPKNRYFNYIVMTHQKTEGLDFVVRKRETDDIWRGMFEFPLIETDGEVGLDQLSQAEPFLELTGGKTFVVKGQPVQIRHILTHQNIHAWFYLLIFDNLSFVEEKNNVFLMNQNRADDYPLPRLILKYLLFLENQN